VVERLLLYVGLMIDLTCGWPRGRLRQCDRRPRRWSTTSTTRRRRTIGLIRRPGVGRRFAICLKGTQSLCRLFWLRVTVETLVSPVCSGGDGTDAGKASGLNTRLYAIAVLPSGWVDSNGQEEDKERQKQQLRS